MSDLSDFGGGAPDPEDKVKIDLSRWFEQHGAQVFWEKRPSYGYSTFHTETTERPDLLVVGARGTARVFAIEVKIPDGGGDVYTGAQQTERYWRNYCFGGEEYRAGGSIREPTAFLLATKFTPDGRLFSRWGARDSRRERSITERLEYFDAPIHFLPDWEFTTTEAVVRMQWRGADAVADRHDETASAGVGALLSTRLDGAAPARLTPEDRPPSEADAEPRALYKSYDEAYGGGANCQNWRWF